MSVTKREVEARGSDVEAAIRAGLQKLGVGRENVIVEILDEGSRGLLGIGSRDAVVRLTSMLVTPTAPPPTIKPVVPKPPIVRTPAPEPAPVAKSTAVTPPPPPSASPPFASESPAAAESLAERDLAVEIMRELLARLQIAAEITTRLDQPDDLTGEQVNIIDIHGHDLGVLIGPRGETLNSLQYVGRLIVSHKQRQRANFIVDVESYRQRREVALAKLAERMAEKAIQRHSPVSLEPMPPHERRIIHMTLRNSKKVYTSSTGEGDQRKVRIYPK